MSTDRKGQARGEAMIKKIEAFIRERALIERGDRVILGVSGGADSVCLLTVLKKIFGEEVEILAVHIHHGLRGKEADRDEAFVRALAERHGIECIVRRADVRAFAKAEKLSEEEAGRVLRYRMFYEVLKERNFHKIAIAHNRDDTAETFLFNLARGSELSGLSGMKERRGKIVRPLLQTGRREIETLLSEFGEEYVSDSTNAEGIYVRNIIRNFILPEMKKGVNARATEHIAETASVLGEVEAFLEEKIEELYKVAVSEMKDGFFVSEEAKKERPLLRRGLIYRVLAEASGKKRDLSRAHVKATEALFFGQTGKRISLPRGVFAERRYEGLLIGTDCKAEGKEKLPIMRTETVETGKIERVLPREDGLTLFFADGGTKNLTQNSCIRWFDYDRITDNVILRTRERGDRLVISPDGKKKKLKSYFIDRKIPREERERIPLVAAGNNILWIVGERTGEGARINEETRRLLKIEIMEDSGGKTNGREDQNNDRQRESDKQDQRDGGDDQSGL